MDTSHRKKKQQQKKQRETILRTGEYKSRGTEVLAVKAQVQRGQPTRVNLFFPSFFSERKEIGVVRAPRMWPLFYSRASLTMY